MPAPVGAVTVIVPVDTEQVGCNVALAVGAAGVAGWALIVTLVIADIQPAALLAVTLYEPAATKVNIPVVLV